MIYTANRNDHHAMLILGYQVITLQPRAHLRHVCLSENQCSTTRVRRHRTHESKLL
jgi:hypothetical protein